MRVPRTVNARDVPAHNTDRTFLTLNIERCGVEIDRSPLSSSSSRLQSTAAGDFRDFPAAQRGGLTSEL